MAFPMFIPQINPTLYIVDWQKASGVFYKSSG